MTRPMLFILMALGMAAVCGSPGRAAAQAASTPADAAAVYTAFIHHWKGEDKHPINVARIAEPIRPDGPDGGCAGHADIEAIIKRPSARIDDLGKLLGPDPAIRYVDPATWKPTDPQHLIEQGKPVDEAVNAGMSAALLTMSAIAFNDNHDVAVFSYAFACGALCGNGGITIMRKKDGAWVPDPRQCTTWISETMPMDRPFRVVLR